ncbi:MerR family transcriptional regulator [Clostridium botulinum]|uniref:MerR family transcriptional regulator n=1 Tax=Clostridium botulinum TaxID=1491 RepID=UPI003DA58655
MYKVRKQYYTVNDITKITGITRRTLHYYDEIGLLKAANQSSHGYRLYDMNDFERLQIILFLKEMDLPLKDISGILQLSKNEQNFILEHHYEILSRKKQKLEKMMSNLESYLAGENIFDLDIFENTSVLPIKEQYKREAKFAYGETEKYKEYDKNLSQLTSEEKDKLFAAFDEKMKKLFRLFSENMKESPSSDNVQIIVKQWINSFQDFFSCDNEILKCIANTYKFDNRFKKYINQFSNEDLSDFVYRAIVFYCDEK